MTACSLPHGGEQVFGPAAWCRNFRTVAPKDLNTSLPTYLLTALRRRRKHNGKIKIDAGKRLPAVAAASDNRRSVQPGQQSKDMGAESFRSGSARYDKTGDARRAAFGGETMTESKMRFAVYGIKGAEEVLLDMFDTEIEAQTYANLEGMQIEHDGAALVVRPVETEFVIATVRENEQKSVGYEFIKANAGESTAALTDEEMQDLTDALSIAEFANGSPRNAKFGRGTGKRLFLEYVPAQKSMKFRVVCFTCRTGKQLAELDERGICSDCQTKKARR